MKKKVMNTYFAATMASVILFAYSCGKEQEIKKETEETQAKSGAFVSIKKNSTKTVTVGDIQGNSGFFSGSVRIGHKEIDCVGACYYSNGKNYHLPCWSHGQECAVFISGSSILIPDLDKDNKYMIENLGRFSIVLDGDRDELSDRDEFMFPARSIKLIPKLYEEASEELWLNIPGQMLYRNANGFFTIHEAFYTFYSVYLNE